MELLIWAFFLEERARARIDWSESAAINMLHSAARDSLRKNVSKCVFGCEGKITMFSFPKNPALCKQWMQFFFPGQQLSFSIVFVDERYKQGQVRRWICTLFDTERWSGLSYKRSRSWFRTAGGKWNDIKCMCLLVITLKCSSLFSSAHCAPHPGAWVFSEIIVKLYLSFINTIKLKTFWRYEGCSTAL